MKDKIEKFLSDNNFLPIGESNPKIKQVKSIISNTKPNPNKLFIAEGIWAHRKVLEFSTPVQSLIVCPDCIVTEDAFAVLEQMTKTTTDRYSVSQKTFQKLSERDKPDGLLAIASLPTYELDSFHPDDKSIVLVLDGIEIPGNIGTMLRTCDGAGIDAVFICNKRARLTHPKLIKGSMGAVLSVPIFEFSQVSHCREWLYSNGFTVYLADTRADKYYYDEPFGKKTALIMGSERYGITREWYDGEYTMICIPQLGHCDSLNVGVAATVLCYEASHKNGKSAAHADK